MALFLFLATSGMWAQEANTEDLDLRLELQKKYKNEVLNYSKDKFDALFFDYFSKTAEEAPLLTKEEYYTYTVKISIYNERLGRLYKDQKAVAEKSKEEWFGKRYSDYLASHKK